MSMGVNAETPASSQTFTDHADAYVEAARLRDELAQTRQMLADAQRLTKTGSWIIDPVGGGASGSIECYRILGLPGKTSSAHSWNVSAMCTRTICPRSWRDSSRA